MDEAVTKQQVERWHEVLEAALPCGHPAHARTLAEMRAFIDSQPSAPRAEAVEAKDAQRYRWLRDHVCNQLYVERDGDHACNYMTAAEWIALDHNDDFRHVPPDEVQRMKDTNTIWKIQIYPNTPVGFNVWYGATLDSVVDAAIAQRADEGERNA